MIICRSFLSFMKTTCYSLCLNYTGRMTRNKANAIIHHWAVSQLNIAKILRTHVNHNKEPIVFKPGRAYILMCNHSSLYDIPLSLEAFPGNVRMLAKKELFDIPLFGQLLKHNEFLSIDRKKKNQAYKDLTLAKQKMEDGIILWTAPEGTRSGSGELQTFKKGVFHLALNTQAIIIPVGIKGANCVLPTKSMQFNPYQNVEVHIGNPIDTQSVSKASIQDLMNLVRNSLKQLLK